MSVAPYQRFRMDRPCPKCGSGPTPSRSCSKRRPFASPRVFDDHPIVPEGDHLHRTCLHCGHERVELALDTPLMAESTRVAEIARIDAQLVAEHESYSALVFGPVTTSTR